MSEIDSKSNSAGAKNIFGRIKPALYLALNPAKVLTEEVPRKWRLYLLMPAVGWMLFFLQVGLDKNLEGYVPAGRIVLIALLGFVLGYAAVGGVGALTAYALNRFKKWNRMDRVTACISLSHTYMIVSVMLGFIYRIFGQGSSAVFGISGLLCTLLPIYMGLRQMDKKNAFFAPLMATLVGVPLMVVWKLLLIIPL